MFKKYDLSGDNELDFKEFSQMFVSKQTGITEGDLVAKKNPTSSLEEHKAAKKQELGVATANFDSPENLLKLFTDKIKARGIRGMVGLQRIFSIMDDDNSGSLTQREFFKACKDFKVGISEENVPTIFKKFDANNDGTMSYDEFLFQIRGSLSKERAQVIKEVYQNLTGRCGGIFSADYAKKAFNPTRHSDVIQGFRTADNVLVEFIETFEAHHNLGDGDPNVPVEEWVDYFHSVSATEENDQKFATNLRNTWGVTPQKQAPKAELNKKTVDDLKNDDAFWKNTKQSELREGQNFLVQRSGMSSQNNPLNHTEDYYPKVNNAARASAKNSMYSQPPAIADDARPKADYASFKNKPVNTDFLKVQEVGKSVPKF